MTLDMEQTKIIGVYAEPPSLPANAQVIDVMGDYICPGFIDLHLHGGGGYSFMDADERRVMHIYDMVRQQYCRLRLRILFLQ